MNQGSVLIREYGQLFGNELGHKILQDLLEGFYYNNPMYAIGSTQPSDLAFREGQRSVVIWLNNTVQAALEAPVEPESYEIEEDDENGGYTRNYNPS